MHVFEVLADPVRRRILELLGAGEMASGEVVEAIGAEFGITQAAVSQHLKVLRESGFARVRPDAQRRLYSVDAAAHGIGEDFKDVHQLPVPGCAISGGISPR